MESYISNLFDNKINVDSDNDDWQYKCREDFQNILEEVKGAEKIRDVLLDSIQLFIVKADSIKFCYPDVTIDASVTLETRLFNVLEILIKCVDFCKLSVKQVLKLSECILSMKRLKYFMGLTFRFVRYECQVSQIFQKFNAEDCNKYFKLLETEFYPNFPKSKENKEIKDYIVKFGELWRFPIESAIGSFDEKQILSSLTSFQHLYEFGIMNCSTRYYCPYTCMCEKMIRTKSYFKDPRSLYLNLFQENDTHILELFELIKVILIEDKNHFDESAVQELGHEITGLLKIEPYKENSLFEKYYKQMSETIFEIYLKTKRFGSRITCRIIYCDVIEIMDKNKNPKKHDVNFQLYLINKINEIALFIKSYEDIEMKKEKNISKEFSDFCYSISYYIKNHCNTRSLALPCVNLVINWLNLYSEVKFIKLAENVLYKDNFFVFKDFLDKFIELLKCLISLPKTIIDKYGNEDKGIGDYKSVVSNCIEYLTKYIKPNPALMAVAQPIILNDFLAKTIIDNIEHDDFFYMTKPLMEVFDLKHFSTKKEDITQLKLVLKHAISPTIIESIQPESNNRYSTRITFYIVFFAKFSETFEKRKDIATEIEPDVCSLLTQINSLNNYDDPIKPGNLTINYQIVGAFVTKIYQNHVNYVNMIHFLIPLVIQIYENHKEIREIKSMFSSFLSVIHQKNAKELANYASNLWKLFLEEKNSSQYCSALQSILPYSKDLFIKEFASGYFDFILSEESNADVLIVNYGLIKAIASFAPTTLLEKCSSSDEIVFDVLVEKIANIKDGLLTYYLTDIFTKMSAEISDSTLVDILYQKINIIFKLLYLESGQDIKELKVLAATRNLEIGTYIFSLSAALTNICTKLIDDENYTKSKFLIKRLVEISKNINEKVEYILNVIQNIATSGNKVFLIKEHKTYFESFKNNSEGYLKQVATHLCDLIEDRSFEKLEQTLNKNLENVNDLKSEIKLADIKVTKVQESVINQESKLTSVEKNINSISTQIVSVDQKLEEQSKRIEIIDDKTLLNVPLWSKEIAPQLAKDWTLIAKRLNFLQNDINSWSTSADPFMSVLQEWYTINKSSEATNGFIKVLREMNHKESVHIIEKYLKTAAEMLPNEDVIDQQLVDSPPQIFLSFQWGIKEKAELLNKYLEKDKFSCWADFGQMGGGDARNQRIDRGLRAANLIVCFVTSDYAKDETSVKQVNLAVTLGKPIIPLVIEKGLKWPPAGSLGPILSGYLFIRFYQRPNEETNDERYWPVDKLDELLMQLKQIIPSRSPITSSISAKAHSMIFISYQWGKQKEINKLYTRLTSFGLTCWLDIKEMSGGDTLYEKIDTGIRNCHVMISCVTEKYGLSANCRKEVLLADSIKKPIIPILLEPGLKYPPSGPMGPILGSLNFIDFTKDLDEQNTWKGDNFNALMEAIKLHLPSDIANEIENKIPVAVRNSKACILS